MTSPRTAERGFALLELMVSLAILAIASAATIGAVAALARNATPATTRDVALMAAENALARIRAAAAYVPRDAADPRAATATAAWALVPGTTAFSAGARLLGPAMCGRAAAASPGSQLLALRGSVWYDGRSSVAVTIVYPREPCAAAADGTFPAAAAQSVTLRAVLAPAAYAPGTVLDQPIRPPARM